MLLLLLRLRSRLRLKVVGEEMLVLEGGFSGPSLR